MNSRYVKLLALGISVLGISVLSCKFLSSIPILASATLEATATATLSPLEVRAGEWQGTTSFGTFAFEVSPDGKSVTGLLLSYKTLEGIYGHYGYIAIDPKGVFEVKGDTFDPQQGRLIYTFQAQFSEDGTTASGYWDVVSPFEASENWEIHNHIGGESQDEPISEATAHTSEPTPIPPAPTKISSTVEPSVIIRLSKSSMSDPIQLEVIKGNYKLVSGAELWEGSNISVQEDWLTFPVGLAIQVGEGGITLKGKKYPSGSILIVDEQESLLEVSGEVYPGVSELPLDILGCNPVSECPESAISIRSFFEENEELPYNTEYPVSVSTDTEVRFFTGWCTSEQGILEENLKQIDFVFTVDGVSFIEKLKPDTYTVQDQNDSTKLNYCHSIGGVISGWQQDQTYRIVFGMKLKAAISDGWDTYGPGNNTRIYLISTSAEISDLNQPLDGGSWQPVTFTIPPGNGYWDQPSENSYNAIGLEDTFIWTEEVYEGDLTVSYDIEILYGNDEWGGGAVILFGDGTGWSKGNLIFFVNGEAQNIQLDTIYDGTVFLAYNTLTLQDNHTYSLTIEILGNRASLFLDGEEIVSATLPTRVNRSGQIGLFKEWAVPEVTFSNIEVKVPSQ